MNTFDRDQAFKNLVCNYQRAVDAGNIAGLLECLENHEKSNEKNKDLHIKAIKHVLCDVLGDYDVI